MSNAPHPEITNEELVKLYEAGESLREIAAVYGITHEAVRLRFKKTGVILCRNRPTRGKPGLERELLVELYYNRKLSLPEVAKRLNVSGDVVRRHFKLYGIALRSREENADLRRAKRLAERPSREELERLYLTEKKKQAEIAEMFQRSQTYVSKWLVSYGLKREIIHKAAKERRERRQKAKTANQIDVAAEKETSA